MIVLLSVTQSGGPLSFLFFFSPRAELSSIPKHDVVKVFFLAFNTFAVDFNRNVFSPSRAHRAAAAAAVVPGPSLAMTRARDLPVRTHNTTGVPLCCSVAFNKTKIKRVSFIILLPYTYTSAVEHVKGMKNDCPPPPPPPPMQTAHIVYIYI